MRDVTATILDAIEVGLEDAPDLEGREVSNFGHGTVSLGEWHGSAPCLTIEIDGARYTVAVLTGEEK